MCRRPQTGTGSATFACGVCGLTFRAYDCAAGAETGGIVASETSTVDAALMPTGNVIVTAGNEADAEPGGTLAAGVPRPRVPAVRENRVPVWWTAGGQRLLNRVVRAGAGENPVAADCGR